MKIVFSPDQITLFTHICGVLYECVETIRGCDLKHWAHDEGWINGRLEVRIQELIALDLIEKVEKDEYQLSPKFYTTEESRYKA